MKHAAWILSALTLAVVWGGWALPAHAGPMLTGYFYSVPNNPTQDPDFEQGVDDGTVTGLVQNTLGPDGLPVVSSYGTSYSGPSGPITMVNGSGELQWWAPSSRYGITYLGQANLALPVTNPDMYVANFPNGFADDSGNGDDSSQLLTAVFKGTFNDSTAGTYSLTSDSDDDTWVFIDGQLVVDNGGVHGAALTTSTFNLAAGSHTLDIFYADRHTTDAEFDLTSFTDPNGNPVNLNPPSAATPEPASLTLLGLGGLALAGYGWRRRRLSMTA